MNDNHSTSILDLTATHDGGLSASVAGTSILDHALAGSVPASTSGGALLGLHIGLGALHA